jgi:predicted Zn finger-like uncharacterized protein
MYSQCPQCKTVFRLEAGQLAAAQGKVRCGRCAHVFDARQSLFDRLLDVPAGLTQPARETASTASVRDSVPAAPAEPPAKHASAERRRPPTAAAPDRPERPVRPAEPARHPGEAARASSEGARSAQHRVMQSPPPRPAAPAGTSWAGKTTPPMPLRDNARLLRTAEPANTAAHEEEELQVWAPRPAGPAARDHQRPAPEPLPPEPDPYLDEGEFGELPQRRRWQTAMWAFGSLVLLVVLGLQYAYFNRDELAARPELRPWLEQLCVYLGCELAPVRDLGSIEISERDVHSHPEVAEALVISATFVNQSMHAQPYPVLQITLSDPAGRPVAARRLRPQEYLSEGVDLGAGMPPRTPVEVRLEVADPGGEAVGFQFDFL